MRCPFCGDTETQVKDSRPAEDHVTIRRRRFCQACGGRFTTYERVQLRDLTVLKKNGRRESFDVICMHRDDVTRAPTGAVVTAMNDHTGIQAFAYDEGAVSFWGVQYHPEATVRDVGYWFSRSGAEDKKRQKAGREIARIADDPVLHADAAARHRVGVDILDRSYHLTEIRNWLKAKVL